MVDTEIVTGNRCAYYAVFLCGGICNVTLNLLTGNQFEPDPFSTAFSTVCSQINSNLTPLIHSFNRLNITPLTQKLELLVEIHRN